MNDITIPIQENKLQKIETHSASVVDTVKALAITNEEEFVSAKELYLMVSDAEKQGKKWLKDIVDPFKKAVKNAENQIKPFLTPYLNAKLLLREKLEVYVAEVDAANKKIAEAERKAREEENKKREEAARLENERIQKEHEEALAKAKAENKEAKIEAPKTVEAELVEPEPVQKVDHSSKTALGGVHTRKTMTFKVVDETKIPKEYFMLDEKKVRQAMKDGVVIPGIEFFAKSSIVARARTS